MTCDTVTVEFCEHEARALMRGAEIFREMVEALTSPYEQHDVPVLLSAAVKLEIALMGAGIETI